MIDQAVRLRGRALRWLGGASIAALALGAQGAHAQVEAGSAHTIVTTAGAATTVTTDNIHAASKTAFNRFNRFEVRQNTTTTLILPTGAHNLVNVVAGNVQVDGAVVSRLQATNSVGGNLFFITSGGFLVGAAGSIDTGRLIVRGGAPTLLNPSGLPNFDGVSGSGVGFDPASLLDYGAASIITIAGTVNAPGGIDLRGTTVTIGAGAALRSGQAGVDAIQAAQGGALVSTAGLVEGTALVKVNGGIAIVGDDTLTVAGGAGATPGALLDARPTTVPGSNLVLDAGIDLRSGGTITVDGTLTAWDGGTGAAGRVGIGASRTAVVDDTVIGSVLAEFFRYTTANTAVSIGGTITGGTVAIESASNASTDPSKLRTTGVGLLVARGVSALLNEIGSGIDVLFTRAETSAVVTTGAASVIRARGDLTLTATGVTHVEGTAAAQARPKGEGEEAQKGIALAIGVAQLRADTRVTLGGTLSAGGAVSVQTANDATGNLTVTALSTKDSLAAAFAITDIGVNNALTVDSGAHIDGASVTLSAINHQASDRAGFDNNAKVISKDGSAGGGAGAVMITDIAATLAMNGTIGATLRPGDVRMSAQTITNHLFNGAGSSTGSGLVADLKSIPLSLQADAGGALAGGLRTFKSGYDTLVQGLTDNGNTGGGGGGGEEDTGDKTIFRFGAAVGVVINNQRAEATSTGTIAATGQVTLDALVRDATLRNNVAASAAASRDDDKGEGIAVAGAAAWADSRYTSRAALGGVVTSDYVAVNATTDRPRGDNFDVDIDLAYDFAQNELLDKDDRADLISDGKNFASDLLAKATPTLGVEKGFFASSAGAVATTDSTRNAAISGTVSYSGIFADTRALLSPGARLLIGKSVDVRARSDIMAISLGGPIPIRPDLKNPQNSFFSTAGGNAAGIAIGFSQIDPTTIAAIGSGVTIGRASDAIAVNVTVDAQSTARAMTITPQTGASNGVTGSGTIASNLVLGSTHATVSKDALLDLGTGIFNLNALSTLELWAVAGSLAVTNANDQGSTSTAGSIGIAGAINYVDLDTRARVGDAGEDVGATGAAAVNAGITAGTVAIDAAQTGSISALSVAGSISKHGGKEGGGEGGGGEGGEGGSGSGGGGGGGAVKGLTEGAKNAISYAKGTVLARSQRGTDTYNEYANKYTKDAANSREAAEQDRYAKGTPVENGFGVAGSASVNISTLTTRVESTGATFRAAPGLPAADAGFRARAVEGVDMLAATGGAAVSTGKSYKSNTLIAGAFGLSFTTNQVASLLDATSVTGFGTVAIEAAANGTRIGAGMALAADTTKSEEGAAVAASVSTLIALDGASAGVTDSAITGGGNASGKLSVLAYNGLNLAAGGIGIAGSGSNAAGAAATFIVVTAPIGGTAAADAKLVRSAVSGFADLSVRALTAARLIGVAAAAAVTTKKDDEKIAVTLGASINVVDMDANALIDTGSDGAGSVNVGGAVGVYAGDVSAGQSEALAASGKTGGTAGTGFLGNYSLGDGGFGGSDPVRTTDLQGGTQILSIAVPIAGARGQAAGVGFAFNLVDNDRTATITGGGRIGGAAISAGSLSVQAIDRTDIFAFGVGVGGSTDGVGIMGSLAANTISGTSAATVGGTAGAARPLSLAIAGAPGAVPNVSIGAAGDGGIFSIAGGIGFGKQGAGGFAVGVNVIARPATGDTPGLLAELKDVTLDGTPDVALLANSRGRIIAASVAGAAGSENASVAGAVGVNVLAPTVAARASGLDYLHASTGDLSIRAADSSRIYSAAIVGAISTSGGAAAAGLSVNRIDAVVNASLAASAGHVLVRNLLIDTRSTAGTTAFGIGVGGGEQFGGAGSIAIAVTDGRVDSLLSYTGGEITASGSIGVVATRDLAVEVAAGALALSSSNVAIGGTLVVNALGGSASARIVGADANSGAITALGGGDGFSVRTGALTQALPQFESFDLFSNLDLATLVKPATATRKGIVVDASSTNAMRTVAITGAASESGVAGAVTAVVGNVTGDTTASVTDANIVAGTGSTAQSGLGIDVRASSATVGTTFAGAIAGAETAAGALPFATDGFSGTTSATVRGGSLSTTGTISVEAVGHQSSTALVVAGAVSANAAGAIAAVAPHFNATVSATLDSPKLVRALGADGVAVNATSDAKVLATFGSFAVAELGSAAAAVVVVVNENATRATYSGRVDPVTGLGTVAVDAAKVAVTANGDLDAIVAGGAVAASAGVSLVGNGVGVVHRGLVAATAEALKYNRADGSVAVRATEAVAITPGVAQVALSAAVEGGSAALGIVAVLAQSKVDATLSRPTVAARTVDVVATGYNQIDVLQLGVAVGSFSFGANVTYIGVGAAAAGDTLFGGTDGDSQDAKVAKSAGSDGHGGNNELAMLAGGGSYSSSGILGGADAELSAGERARVGANTGSTGGAGTFAQTNNPGEAADARVRAQVTGGTGAGRASVAATTLTIDSDANVRSRSSNVAANLSLFAGGTATVDVTRNAARSIAYLGDVAASGGTLDLTATTGQAGAPGGHGGITGPTKAADSRIYAGVVSAGAGIAVGVSDVALSTAAQATALGSTRFDTATVKAEDLTEAAASVTGAVVAINLPSINVAVANVTKSGTVLAEVGGTSDNKRLDVVANARGGASAESYAGGGGLFPTINAVVAHAGDTRVTTARINEASLIRTPVVNVLASTLPSVQARTLGVGVSLSVAVGASVADVTLGGSVNALVGEGALFSCVDETGCRTGKLRVAAAVDKAAGGYNLLANAHGSAGSTGVTVSGASAAATTDIATNAVIGANLSTVSAAPVLLSAAALELAARRDFAQLADVSGITIGGIIGLGVGTQTATAKAGGTTRAAVENVDGGARGLLSGFVGDAAVIADALDHNDAKAVSGAGGFGAGLAATAITESNGQASAELRGAAGRTFMANALTVTAEQGADYHADSSSVLATAVGGSGTVANNSVGTAATVTIGRDLAGAAAGANTRLEATSFRIGASNKVGEQSSDAGRVEGAGGGALVGAAALVTNRLQQNAIVDLADGVTLRQYGGDPTLNTRATFIDAGATTSRDHHATLTVGGLIAAPVAKLDATYGVTTAVNVGRNVLIRGDQGIGLGTTVEQSIADTGAAQVFGLAAVGVSVGTSTSTVAETIRVGDGTTIEGMGDIRVSAGTSADGTRDDRLQLAVQTDTFNWTVLPLSSESEATATVNQTTGVTLGSAIIRSARDVLIAAEGGETHASAVGTGHNPYLELLSQTISSGSVRGTQAGSVTLDGTAVTAGFLGDRTITVTQAGSGVAIATNETDAYPLVNGLTDPDRLGRYVVTTGTFAVLDYLDAQIATLYSGLTAQGLTLADPAGFADGSPEQQAARDRLAAAAATSTTARQLGSLYESRIALKLSGVSGTNAVIVGGTMAGDPAIFAGGGAVALNADAIVAGARQASIRATGGGRITIDNTSDRNIVLGNMFVPAKPAGAITYGGTATALPAGIVATLPGGGATGTGAITVTSGRSDTSPRTDVIVLGSLQNIGGDFRATASNGNFIQFGQVSVANFGVTAPNGIFTVSMPNSGFSQGDPLAFYRRQLQSLYAGGGLVLQEYQAVNAVTTYLATVFASTVGDGYGTTYTPGNVQEEQFLKGYYGDNPLYLMFLQQGNTNNGVDPHRAGSDGRPLDYAALVRGGFQGHSFITSSCVVNACEWASSDQDIPGLQGTNRSEVWWPFRNNGGGQYGQSFWTLAASLYDINVAAKLNPGELTGSYTTTDAIRANQIFITAKTANISGQVIAGPTKQRTLTIDGAADGGATMTGNIGATLTRTGQTGYITVADVAAGAGGTITIDAKLLNSNPIGGELRVLNGYANIQITNNTGYELRLGTISAGQSVDGRITLRDRDAAGNAITTIYTNSAGGQVTVAATNAGGVTTTNLLSGGQGIAGGAALRYQPTGRYVYVWDESRNLTRTIPNENAALPVQTVSAWRWADGGQQAQSTRLVNVADDTDEARLIRAALDSGGTGANIAQLISGSFYNSYFYGRELTSGDVKKGILFELPLGATVSIKTAVSATNPIGIVFDQGSYGGISVSSPFAPIVVGGALTSGGSTGISLNALYSSVTLAGGQVVAPNVSLVAAQTIGSAADPFKVSLLGGNVSAYSGNDLWLQVDSVANNGGGRFAPVYLGGIAAGHDIHLSANADLVSAYRDNYPAGNFNDLVAQHVFITTPGRVIGGQFGPDGLAIAIPTWGSLSIVAGGDVEVRQRRYGAGDDEYPVFRIASIETPGDVTIRALGSIVAADATATVDQAKLQRFLASARALQLAPGATAIGTPIDSVMRDEGRALFALLASPDVAMVGDARAKLTALFGAVPMSAGAIDTLPIDRRRQIAYQLRNEARAAWDEYNLGAADRRGRAVNEVVSRVEQIRSFGGNAGLSVSADGATVSVTDWSVAGLRPGGALYQLALSTLRTTPTAGGRGEAAAQPTDADVAHGLQLYLTALRAPIADLVGNTLPVLGDGDQASRVAAASAAISDTALASWTTQRKTGAAATLTAAFGTLPLSRDAIATATITPDTLAARTTGAVWTQTMLDVAVPSTAFVPVADTQFETRTPVIRARGVTLIARDSIGAFDAEKTFSYDRTGFTGVAADRDLASAYLASAGPGDLVTTVRRDAGGAVDGVSFTTRRDQPLQLDASGTINAFAALNFRHDDFADPLYDGTTANSRTSPVRGDIFLTSGGRLTIGSIISQKGRDLDAATTGCTVGSAAAAACESRIRLAGSDIVGVTTGALARDPYTYDYVRYPNGSGGFEPVYSRLANEDGSAVIMGGLIRLEASTGSIRRADGGALRVDADALEVLRAAGDISLAKRVPATIPGAAFTTVTRTREVPNPNYSCGVFGANDCRPTLTEEYREATTVGFSFGRDLLIGDVFAGGRFSVDNPVGSLLITRLPSPLASENRNSRIVISSLALRAAGDIGSGSTDATGLVGQFDIQAPLIEQLVAGWDPATGGVKTVRDTGEAAGDVWFALRGPTRVGGVPGGLLGARGDINIGTVPGYPSSVSFQSDIVLGGSFNLATDGDVDFANPDIRITGIGAVYSPDTVDLSKLSLRLGGRFSFVNARSIVLGSLSAAGGTIESTGGSVTVNGTLTSRAPATAPMTLAGKTGILAGALDGGAVTLRSSAGDIAVTGDATVSDLIATGGAIGIGGTLAGRTAMLTGTGTVSLTGGVAVSDRATVRGTTIAVGPNTRFTNMAQLTLDATDALLLDPAVVFSQVEALTLKAGTTPLSLGAYTGGSLVVAAPEITLGALTLRSGATVTSSGIVTLGGPAAVGGTLQVDAGRIVLAPGAGIVDSGTLSLTSATAIALGIDAPLVTRGTLTIAARDSLALGMLAATGGSIAIGAGDLSLAGLWATGAFDLHAGGALTAGRLTVADLRAEARDIAVNSGLYGRSATLTAAPTGIVSLGGSALLQRDAQRPTLASELILSGGAVTLSNLVAAQDKVTVRGQTITGGGRTTFLNAGVIDLQASGALRLDPATTFVNVGTATLSSGSAAAGGSAVTIGSFSGGSLRIDAPVGIAIGSATLTKGLTLNTQGSAVINGTVVATGAVSATARTIGFGAASQGVLDSSVLQLTADTIATTGSTSLRSRGALTVATRDTLALAAVRGAGGAITVSGGDLQIGNGLTSDGASFTVQASGAVRFMAATTLAGSLAVTAGTDILLSGATAMNGTGRNAALSLSAGRALTMGPQANVTAIATGAAVQIAAGTVTIDASAAISGASVNVNAIGAVTLGDIRANQAAGQLVSLRAGGALSVGQVTAGTTLITAAGGTATLRGPVSAADLTVTARDDIATSGIAAAAAMLNSSTGGIALAGTTRIRGASAAAPGATLSVTAAKSIVLAGPVSAASGMMLMGKAIATTGSGAVTDADNPGALTTLRADTINVAFDTGQATGLALRIDARGYSSANVDDATFRFATLRPIQFDALFVNKGTIAATTALTYLNKQVRDYLTTAAGTSGPSGGATTGGGTTPAPTPPPTPEPTPPPTTTSSRARAR